MFAAGSADAALLIFTLAAVTPEEMPAMLHTAFQVGLCLCGSEAPYLTQPLDGISDVPVMTDLCVLQLCLLCLLHLILLHLCLLLTFVSTQ